MSRRRYFYVKRERLVSRCRPKCPLCIVTEFCEKVRGNFGYDAVTRRQEVAMRMLHWCRDLVPERTTTSAWLAENQADDLRI